MLNTCLKSNLQSSEEQKASFQLHKQVLKRFAPCFPWGEYVDHFTLIHDPRPCIPCPRWTMRLLGFFITQVFPKFAPLPRGESWVASYSHTTRVPVNLPRAYFSRLGHLYRTYLILTRIFNKNKGNDVVVI